MSQNLQARFESYDKENPAIFQAFRKFADELMAAGVTRAGAKFIVERIRWETATRAREDGARARFKINNNFPGYYARKLMEIEPQRFANFFHTRSSLS